MRRRQRRSKRPGSQSSPTCTPSKPSIKSLYDEYEEIIKENNLTNGRVDISIEIINQKYKENILNGGFLEEKYTELLQEVIKNKKAK